MLSHAANGSEKDTAYLIKLMDRSFELQTSNPDSAYQIAAALLIQSEKLDYPKGISAAHMRMGSILNMRGENRQAVSHVISSYQLRKATGDLEGATSACIRLSYIYSSLGKIDSTFFYIYEALSLAKLSIKTGAIRTFQLLHLTNLKVEKPEKKVLG
jgi:hypothetical protein